MCLFVSHSFTYAFRIEGDTKRIKEHIYLKPLVRLNNVLTSYGLSCEQLYLMDLPAWRKAVKQAVLHKALFFYEPKQSLAAARLPGFMFEYLGRQYLHHDGTSELADLAVQLRADRLPGVPHPCEYHPCLWCSRARGLNGLHLLQCSAVQCLPV